MHLNMDVAQSIKTKLDCSFQHYEIIIAVFAAKVANCTNLNISSYMENTPG